MVRVGDRVRVIVLPPWVVQLLPECQEVFQRCVGKVFTVLDLNELGHPELWVKNGRDQRRIVGADIIWVDPEYCEILSADTPSTGRRTPSHPPTQSAPRSTLRKEKNAE